MRKLLIASIVLILLITSCKVEEKTMVLSSNTGSEIYFIEKSSAVVVSFSGEFQEKLASLESLSISDMLKDFFPDATLFSVIEDEEYSERLEIISLLSDISGSANSLESFYENRKVLKDSKMLSTLDELSGGFDSALLESMEKKAERYKLYYADRVLHGEYDYEGAKKFLLDWIDSIKR